MPCLLYTSNPGADQTLDIDTADLQEMVETTLYAVSTDDKKPAHTGELFAIEPEKLTVVALDGYRLAIIEKPVKAAKAVSYTHLDVYKRQAQRR